MFSSRLHPDANASPVTMVRICIDKKRTVPPSLSLDHDPADAERAHKSSRLILPAAASINQSGLLRL